MMAMFFSEKKRDITKNESLITFAGNRAGDRTRRDFTVGFISLSDCCSSSSVATCIAGTEDKVADIV